MQFHVLLHIYFRWIPRVFNLKLEILLFLKRDSCDDLEDKTKRECLSEYMEFYTYKVIKSMFNLGRASIYVGLWATRNVSLVLIAKKNLKKYKFKYSVSEFVTLTIPNRTVIFFGAYRFKGSKFTVPCRFPVFFQKRNLSR